MNDSLANWASLIASIATFVVSILTLFTVIIARNTLKLLQSQENRLRPELEPYLIESFIKEVPDGKSRIYAFNIRITNKSDANGTIKDLDLIIAYHRDPTIQSEAIIPLLSSKTDSVSISKLSGIKTDILKTPIVIDSHGVVTGWALYKIDKDILTNIEIDAHKLRFMDTYDKEYFLNIIYIKEQ